MAPVYQLPSQLGPFFGVFQATSVKHGHRTTGQMVYKGGTALATIETQFQLKVHSDSLVFDLWLWGGSK